LTVLGRTALWLAAAAALIAVTAVGYWNAIQAPLVRRLLVTVPDYPAAEPVRIVLFSDVHVHGPDMPPERVGRIVDQINALHPDIIVAAGDFAGANWIGRSYPIADAIAPLARLRARLGVYAALGNNDYAPGKQNVLAALRAAGIRPLVDQAEAVGPLALAGLRGSYGPSAAKIQRRRGKVYRALAAIPGVKIVIAHRPDEFHFAPSFVALMLSGHTHCGQIDLPLLGPLETGSDYGRRYLCGVIRNGPQALVVSAGVGTSHIPIRYGAPPDIWLIEVAPKRHGGA
jgi:predicted MPP superfamily phosphohydrolase